MTYSLTVFGDCRLVQSDGKLVRVPTQAVVMLVYLYISDQPVSRRELARFLWPQSTQTAALTNLRSTLRRFFAQLPEADVDFLEIDDRHLQIKREAIGCDLDILEASTSEERLTGLAEAIQKVFLPALGGGRSELDKWALAYRKTLLDALRVEFLDVCSSRLLAEKRQTLKHIAALLLEHDPLDDEVRATLAKLTSVVEDRSVIPARVHRGIELPVATSENDSALLMPQVPRLALLPPGALSDGSQQQGVANALIEDITISLCTDRSVSVVAPYTSQKIAASQDKAALLAEHKVVFALDTKKTANELFAQLIFMPTDEVIWAHRFQLDSASSANQRAIIHNAIQSSISEQVSVYSPYLNEFNSSPDAYFAYLHGLQNLSSMTLPSMRKARRHFKEALKYQSRFAPALAGISRTLSMEWVLTARGDNNLLLEAEHLAKLAIEEDQNSAGAFKELGVSQLYMDRIDESLVSLHYAESLSPHYADVLCSYADSLTHGGSAAIAMEKIESAISLNPIAPDTYFWTAAGASYFVGEYRQAIDYIKKMSDSSSAFRLAAACWGMLGQTAKARTCRHRVLKDNPDFDLENWLAMIPTKEKWQVDLYREGLLKAGF